MQWLFKLRGDLTKSQRLGLEIGGVILFLGIWILLTSGSSPILKPATLPHPWNVLTSFGDLYRDNDLITNTTRSIGLNLSGYVLAIIISIPLGFLIGLVPLFRGLFQRFLDAIRFVPLTATIGLFIVWFGIGSTMKSLFLAFGIVIFFLPVVVQRIDEVGDVYLKTVYTLGANWWQTVRTVYFPSVMSRLWDDLRIMTAISWTYIVFVEAIGSQGGLGHLITYGARRQGRIDKMFALLVLIILIGIFQDRIFAAMDKKLFPHKYQVKKSYKDAESLPGSELWKTISAYIFKVFTWVSLGFYILLALDGLFGVFGNLNILSTLFGESVWSVHLVFLSILGYQVYSLLNNRKKSN